MLLVAPGITTRNKKLLVTKGIATGNKGIATRRKDMQPCNHAYFGDVGEPIGGIFMLCITGDGPLQQMEYH